MVIEVNNNSKVQLLCPKRTQLTSKGKYAELMDNDISSAGGKGLGLVRKLFSLPDVWNN